MTTAVGKDLVVTREFAAPVERVWQAFSDSNQVMRWWGPNRFICPVAQMDFREGGTSLVCMRAPAEFGGRDMYNTWTYRQIVPHSSIEYVLDWADANGNRIDPTALGLPPEMPRDVRHVITFKKLGADRTEMTITEFGYLSEQIMDLSRRGLEECLDKMAAIFVTA